jgi:SRSO17 transposase
MEPLAAESRAEPKGTTAEHQRLQHFLTDSRWDDREVRLYAARYAIAALEAREPVTTWVIDDTGFPKKGTHSVGVKRQYSGTLGKVGSCQVGVSLSVATRSAHVPIDFELYLPEDWTEDARRRKEARIPDDVVFRTKPQLALAMIERALDADIPGEILLGDGGYGHSSVFRDAVRLLGFEYGFGVLGTLRVRPLDARERGRGAPVTARDLARSLPRKAFRHYTWREGTNGRLRSRFAFRRVKVEQDDGLEPASRDPVWLVIEWPDDEDEPTKYFLTTLKRRLPKKEIVRTIKERYRTERVYEEMKGELGLDHFEGRTFRGWHHHVSVALCCFAFVTAERSRHFPPSARRARDADAHRRAA